MSKEDFVARARTALSAAADDSAQAPSSGGGVPSQAPDSAQPTGNTSTESSGQATPSSATEQEPSTVQTLLSERAARLEAQRKKEAEEAKLRRKAKAAEGEKPKGSEAQTKHAESLKRRQKEAREERQRILQAIEDDKAARKARQSEKEAERKLAFEAQNQDKQTASPALSSTLPATTRSSQHCFLQVRLFDGSTLRNRFPSGSRLGADVRKWVDENRGDDKHPYTFKVVLTPLPNKNIDITEEDSSLQDLGLTPSSTLILVPASKTAVAAYAASSGNPVSRFIAFILALINGFIANIIAFFTTMFSTSGPPRQHPAPEAGREQTAVASGLDEARIKELRTLRERRNEQQFYNGNSVCCRPWAIVPHHVFYSDQHC